MRLTEIEMNVLAVAIDHMHEHLDNLAGRFGTFEQEKDNLKRIEAVKSLSVKLRGIYKNKYDAEQNINYITIKTIII